MSKKRQVRTVGDTLELGGVSYRLESIEGSGSSVIVYKASYRDSLNTETLHYVFIKELFPLSEEGAIYRDADGKIVYTDQGRKLMEISRSRFFMGNQVNLQLLNQMPENTSGNINSYEAYGTYYSVLSAHGGMSLRNLLVEEKKEYSLRETVLIMKKILAALEVFHQNGFLHLDISPDNILLLPEQAFLIDYNSVWDLRKEDLGDFIFSVKPGYTAPEVRLENKYDIQYTTDIYSVCAVFFHMVMHRRLREEEWNGHGLHRCFSASLSIFRDVPQTAVSKTIQILQKGLRILCRKRYQNIAELQADLEELLNRIDGKGVSHSALWESSLAAWKRNKNAAVHYLPQSVMMGEQEVLTQAGLVERLECGGKFLLIGPGGMGKTSFLTEIWKKKVSSYQHHLPACFYISLKDYQETAEESLFIRSSILRGLQFCAENPHYQDALHELEILLGSKSSSGNVSVVLLLDGLNEAGDHQENLLIEIEELGKKAGVGILVTDRSKAVCSYGLRDFSIVELSPLSDEQVAEELERTSILKPHEQSVMELLTNPMMLFLYIETMKAEADAAVSQIPNTSEGLIELYLESFYRKALRSDSGNKGKQLCTAYILHHMLPDIALEMQRKRKTLLTFEELCRVSDRSYRQLLDKSFGEAFPEYCGKSRVMFAQIAGSSEWYDFAVNERLIDRFGLLVRSKIGNYGLLHDNFQNVLTSRAGANQKQLRIRKWKAWRVKGTAVLAAVVLLGAVGYALIWNQYRDTQSAREDTPKEAEYTEEEEALIEEAMVCLNSSLMRWSLQIQNQQQILSEAQVSDVLDNKDDLARQFLEEIIVRMEQQISAVYASSLSDDICHSLVEIENNKGLFSVDTMQFLCDRNQEMDGFFTAAMEHTRNSLCNPNSIYATRDKRERLVQVYKAFLDSEIKYVSYQLASLLAEMTPEQQEDIREALPYMEAFADFYDGPGSVAPKYLPDGRSSAYENLKKTQQAMNAEGFGIHWE